MFKRYIVRGFVLLLVPAALALEFPLWGWLRTFRTHQVKAECQRMLRTFMQMVLVTKMVVNSKSLLRSGLSFEIRIPMTHCTEVNLLLGYLFTSVEEVRRGSGSF